MNKEQINKKDIRKDISKYIKLRTTNLTSEREYTKLRLLEEKAEELCRKFYHDVLDVSSVSPEDWADYLNLFCYGDFRRECLEKLKQQTGFDPELYLSTSRRQGRKSDTLKYMPAWKLKLKYLTFRRLCKKINSSIFPSYKQISKAEALSTEAERYLNAYLKDEIKVKNKDAEALRNYFCVMSEQKNSKLQSAVDKLTVQIRQHKSEKPVPFLQKLRKRISTKVKVAAVAGVAVIGSLFGAKTCFGIMKNNTASSPQKEVVVKRQSTDTVLAKAEVKQKIHPVVRTEKVEPMKKAAAAPRAKQVKTVAQPEKMSSEQTVWKNYYDTALDILCKDAKKQKLYQKIDSQVQKGMFTLPQGVSREKLVYTYIIYQKYGIASSVEDALTATKKLSAEAQKQLADDILAAGNKGQGVKALAQKRYGSLSQHSSYNQAGKQLQKKHVHNLQELFKLKKLSQNCR